MNGDKTATAATNEQIRSNEMQWERERHTQSESEGSGGVAGDHNTPFGAMGPRKKLN